MVFKGLIAKPDGSVLFRAERRGPAADAVALGTSAGEELKDKSVLRARNFSLREFEKFETV